MHGNPISASPEARAALAQVPSIPCDAEGPVFAEPWQARAFAFAVELNRRGLFTWKEWAATLSDEIAAAQKRGDPARGDTYYDHWLAAVERLVSEKGLTTPHELDETRDAWDRAARATPHGQPILLGAGD